MPKTKRWFVTVTDSAVWWDESIRDHWMFSEYLASTLDVSIDDCNYYILLL